MTRVRPGRSTAAIEVAGGLAIEAYAVPGKVALYLEQAGPGFGTREGDSIGLEVSEPAPAPPSTTSRAAPRSMRAWRSGLPARGWSSSTARSTLTRR